MHVLIAGAGLAGLSAAKYLTDAGHRVTVLEKRPEAGGKVSSWQDADGDWLESGLHVFFGAYRNLHRLFKETQLDGNLTWKAHTMTFSRPGGWLSPLHFAPRMPAPAHGLLAIARNRGVLSQVDKLRVGYGLLWPILGNQAWIDAQDRFTYAQWHMRHGMGRRALGDFFDTMALALNFDTTDRVSAKLVLTVLTHFAKETDASRVAFLKGTPQRRLFEPLLTYLTARGVTWLPDSKVAAIDYDVTANQVTGLRLADGRQLVADAYVSAMPVHNLWKTLPPALRAQTPFAGLRHLHGQPVMTVQLYFDRPVIGVDNLIFSSGTHLSVYAEMSRCAPDLDEGREGRHMVEMVVAPAAEWYKLDEDEVIRRTLAEFTRLHPAAAGARLVKSTLVRIPQSVYRARPGHDAFRPDQVTPVPNLYLCGDYTRQEYLASMEGAVLSGKRVADRIVA
ncbi:MAG TPA: FAD-dependent oxidoreductase [Chloroflexia bacterium]|nr:FAD-dependent oxidoreductase [Chloroflexia bacterium]